MATHVTVEFDEAFRTAVVGWRRGLSNTPADCKKLADIYLEELCKRLIRYGGQPPRVRLQQTITPPRYWCELTGGTWVGYTITDATSWFTQSLVLRLVALQPAPPPEARPTTPPG